MAKFKMPSPGDRVHISAMPQLGTFTVKSVYLSNGYPACKLEGEAGNHTRFVAELEDEAIPESAKQASGTVGAADGTVADGGQKD